MKKTAVERLLDEIYGQGILDGVEQYCHNTLEQLYKQAKEMEKEQIINAYINGIHSECYKNGIGIGCGKQYYNQTYKQD